MLATITTRSLKLPVFILAWLGLAVNLGGGPAWAAPTGSPWGSNYFPNAELTTQDGEKLHFYDDVLKGKIVAINFIYTRCTAACPLETAAMRKIYHELGDHMGRDIFFYTISIDGTHDDPAELKAYAKRYKTGPGWTFLTGRPQDVTLIRQKMGMYRADGKAERDFSEHSTVILMGSEKLGQWIKRSPYEEPKALARILKTRLLRKHDGAKPMTAAVEVADPGHDTPGGKLYQANCAACHSLGSDNGIGPGLAGVSQSRDRGWLKRWIKEPDQLLRAKDPLALALFNQYNQVYMPNLKLSDQEVEALLAYLDGAAKPQLQATR